MAFTCTIKILVKNLINCADDKLEVKNVEKDRALKHNMITRDDIIERRAPQLLRCLITASLNS